MDVEAVDLGTLPGLEDVLGDLDAQGAEVAAGETAARLEAADLPLHATMGVRDSIGSLIAWAKGRKLVRTLPEDVVPVTWFECHVPHAGTAQERFEAKGAKQADVAIKAFGSGLGRGRSVGLTISSGAATPRSACVSYVVDLRVLPQVYASDGRESVVAEVLGPTAHRTIENRDCPFCRLAPEAVDPFENVLEPATDLRTDSAGQRRVVTLDWSSERSLDTGLKLPRAGVDISLNARVTGSGSLSIEYDLKGGYLYQEYRPIDLPGSAPRWAYST